jgi:hypothetical protein
MNDKESDESNIEDDDENEEKEDFFNGVYF